MVNNERYEYYAEFKELGYKTRKILSKISK